MTEDTYTPPTSCVVPEGVDPVDGLTVRELDIVSRQLGADVLDALSDQNNGKGMRWAAMARLVWLWARRTDPRAKLDPFLDLSGDQLNALLQPEGSDDEQLDEQAGGDDLDVNPTDSAPAS